MFCWEVEKHIEDHLVTCFQNEEECRFSEKDMTHCDTLWANVINLFPKLYQNSDHQQDKKEFFKNTMRKRRSIAFQRCILLIWLKSVKTRILSKKRPQKSFFWSITNLDQLTLEGAGRVTIEIPTFKIPMTMIPANWYFDNFFCWYYWPLVLWSL